MSRLSQRLIGLLPMPIILFLLFFCISLVFPQKISATPTEFVKAVQKGNNLQWYLGGSSGMVATTTDSLMVSILGAYDESGKLISNGAIQATGQFMATLYQKPASSTQYLAYVLNKAGVIKPALAKGSGWDFLNNTSSLNSSSPILQLWTFSRNVTYVFFIIVFVVIGFMIMFRSKLNPQTVINIQLALPSIIVGLILVTFSFAVCGFIIDFVYLGHNLINYIYFNGGPLQNIYVTTDYLADVYNLDILTGLLGASGTTWAGVSVFSQLAAFFTNMADTIASGNLVGTIMPLIFAFTLLGTGFKIFFALITKYTTIILSTIFSPFIFLLSSFPGKTEGLMNFFKTMLSAALTFPAIAFMFYLASFFASKAELTLNSLPPLSKVGVLQTTTIPGSVGGSFGGRVLEPLIALGLLMAATQIPQAIDQALGVKAGIAGAATPDISTALRKIPIVGSLLG